MNQAATENSKIPLHVVLYQPEIPQNTGNIGRTCTALGAKLWIVQPAGFRLDSTQIRRSGLDYWADLNWESVANWETLLTRLPSENFWLVSKFGSTEYYKAEYQSEAVLVIGRESNGLPESIRQSFPDRTINIPMPGPVRSLNQASAAAIVMYEAAKRIGMMAS